jgi:hypothetical protein
VDERGPGGGQPGEEVREDVGRRRR